ncbi:Holliday junction resolvase RuvX [soil metagenome]
MQGAEYKSGRIAALDLGEVRTGVAVSDPGATLARPLEVVPSGQLDEYLRGIIDSESISEVVVGVPRTLKGEIGFQARRVTERIEALKAEFPAVRFIEWDERMTTRLAVAGQGRKKRGKNREPVDHIAAARLLQEHLDTRGDG